MACLPQASLRPYNPAMARATNLYRLQEVDEALRDRRQRLDEIERILSEDEAVTEAERQVEAAQSAFVKAKSINGDAEQVVAAQRAKMDKTDHALYSGTVTEPKQLEELQMEAASLKKYMATLEDRLLEAMVELEGAEETFESAKKALNAVRAEVVERHGELNQERTQLQTEVERLETEREATVSNVREEDLETYQRIQARVGRLPLSLVENGSCSVCGIAIPGGRLQKARNSDELVRCGQCGRILYAG
jgi:predicted  nucleic acid-binding Zn-ribbon protein